MESLPKRKHIRLPPEAYTEPTSIFFLTIDTLGRREYFSSQDFNVRVILQLQQLAIEKTGPVNIYSLMPTHLHLLISPGSVSVVRWVALFKQRSQHMASQRGIPKLWQRSFFDHRIRSTERLAEVIEYIRHNPVRAGLADQPEVWPWTGSVLW